MACREELRRTQPVEILIAEELKEIDGWVDRGTVVTQVPEWTLDEETGRTFICEHCRVLSLDGFGFRGMGPAVGAAVGLVRYLTETLKGSGHHLQPLKPFRADDYLRLDGRRRGTYNY